MINNFFKKAVGLGVATALAFSVATAPVMAGENFHQEDLRDRSTKFVQAVAQKHGKKELSFVVHGDEADKMAHAVHQVANYFDEQGEKVALFLAPDIDNIPYTTHVEIFHNGSRYILVGSSDGNINEFQQAVFEEATKAKDHINISHSGQVAGENPLISKAEYNN